MKTLKHIEKIASPPSGGDTEEVKRLSILFLLLTVMACTSNEKPPFSVTHHGVLREIMQEQKLHGRVTLEEFSDTPGFFALGAMENLKGEILILDGAPVNGIAKSGELAIDRSMEHNAALLVGSSVEAWTEIHLDATINDFESLQFEIKEAAKKVGIDTNHAFPFLLRGTIKRLDWHVINASEATEQNHNAYKEAGLSGTVENEVLQILGFYSEKHQGVFTHHGSFLHMHFVNDEESIMGHVDDLSINGAVILMLPKTGKNE